MNVEIKVDATDPNGRTFLTWAPVKGSVRLTNAGGAQGPVSIVLRNGGKPGGGRVIFDTQRSDDGKPDLRLSLPTNLAPVEFFVAGEFKHPSSDYGDAAIEAVDTAGTALGRLDLMVRIRKDATTLSNTERDRFLLAIGKLNNAGQGPFQSFRDTHVAPSRPEAHGFPGFPPWHRAYLLDLERALQGSDFRVALPYWRFDKPAASLFAPEFFGMPPSNRANGDVIQFPHGHALEFWKTDGNDPIERRPLYNIAGAPPQTVGGQPRVISQAATLALGTQYAQFRGMESAPHGFAHTSFQGPINNVPTAAKDPLFFLLHANVDRLWAFWQWLNRRTDPSNAATYSTAGNIRPPGNIGHKLGDTMWPWNQSRTPPRPTFPPPRGNMTASPVVNRPGPTPRIQDMIDYQGIHGGGSLGFDYDDVPFELQGPVA